MEYLAIILFGILQGITEFLPVSSSGHLTLMQYFSEDIPESLSLNIAVHLGTLCSIFVFYRNELTALISGFFKKDRESLLWVLWIVGATIPTALLGLTVKKVFPWILVEPLVVGICFLVTGFILFSARWVRQESGSSLFSGLSLQKALCIGLIQGIAVLPGLSRSGLTIVASLWMGVEKETAARFSFLISIPAILGAALLEVLSSEEVIAWDLTILATVTSFLVGLGAISLVVWLTKKQRLSLFSYYLWVLGLFIIGKMLLNPS